jgi:hypothetical protein
MNRIKCGQKSHKSTKGISLNSQVDDVLEYPQDSLLTDESITLNQHLEPFANGPLLDRNSKVMKYVSSHEFRKLIRKIVAEICTDRDRLHLCAQRSQSHPLGFSKVLVLSTKQYQIRLNFWPEIEFVREREDIHDHRFDFASTIFTGTLVEELYEVADLGDPMIHFVDQLPARYGEPYILNRIGTIHAKKVSAHRLAQGSAYVTRSESLHRIIAIEGAPLVTAFVKFSPIRAHANVLVAPTAASERELQVRHFFTPETIFSTLQQILMLMPE